MALPILYSYRRCPYAMRARMALKLANIDVEIREISLREKPEHMLQISPKGTVPVLVLPNGSVIDESLEIMRWALQYTQSQAMLDIACEAVSELITEHDGSFKPALDAYKYPERFPEKPQLAHRQQGEIFLQKLEHLLKQNKYLFGAKPSFADYAIFPFIRQFAAVDSAWFEAAPYPNLRAWLNGWIASELFMSIMTKKPTFID